MFITKHLLRAFFVSTLMIFSSTAAFAGWDALAPTSWFERIRKEIAKQELGASVSLVTAEIIDGITTSLRYKIESEPSYVDGYYTRIDKYRMRFEASPLDLFDDLDTPFGINLKKDSEIIFARQFKDQATSLTALPYTMKNLPITAERAISNLVPGDFVAFEGKLSVILSLGHEFFKGQFKAGISTHAFISGEFIVHIFRMANNKVRVRLIAVQSEGSGTTARIDLDKDFEIFGVRLLDNRLEEIIEITPLDIRAGVRKNNVVMLDYVFNLNNPEAANAYNSLLLHKVQLKDVHIANPNASRADLAKEVFSDLTDVENLALADATLDTPQRRVDRIFKGSTEGMMRDSRTKFGLNLFRIQGGRSYGENKVLNYDRFDKQQHFLLDTFSRYTKTKILFGLFGEETLYSSNLMFTSDPNWNPLRFVTLTSSAQMKMKDLSAEDFKEIQRLVKETIGPAEFNKIPWSKWDFSNGKVINGYFRQEVFFNPDALSRLPTLSPHPMKIAFEKYLATLDRPRSFPLFGSMIDYFMDWISSFRGDAESIGTHLATIVHPRSTIEKRFAAFEELHQIPVWRERGMGFLISLLPPDGRADLLRFELTMSGKNAPPLEYSFGKFTEENLYRSLMYIQNILNNRSIDLRYYSDREQNQIPPLLTRATPML